MKLWTIGSYRGSNITSLNDAQCLSIRFMKWNSFMLSCVAFVPQEWNDHAGNFQLATSKQELEPVCNLSLSSII